YVLQRRVKNVRRSQAACSWTNRTAGGLMRFWHVLLLLALWPGVLTAQSPSRAATTLSSAASAFAPERLSRIDSWLDDYIRHDQLAGVMVWVLKDGQPVYKKAVGWQDGEAGIPLGTSTLFRLASQTKAITIATFLTLFDEGRVGLDEP